MSNKTPATQVINYPSMFKPLLDKELEEKGYYSYPELMGHILAEHYGTKPTPPVNATVKEVDEK